MQHTRRLFLQSSRAREYQIRRSPSELIPYWKTSLTPVPTPRPSSSNGSRRISEPSRWRRRLYKGKITKQFESRFVDAPGCSGVVDSGRQYRYFKIVVLDKTGCLNPTDRAAIQLRSSFERTLIQQVYPIKTDSLELNLRIPARVFFLSVVRLGAFGIGRTPFPALETHTLKLLAFCHHFQLNIMASSIYDVPTLTFIFPTQVTKIILFPRPPPSSAPRSLLTRLPARQQKTDSTPSKILWIIQMAVIVVGFLLRPIKRATGTFCCNLFSQQLNFNILQIIAVSQVQPEEHSDWSHAFRKRTTSLNIPVATQQFKSMEKNRSKMKDVLKKVSSGTIRTLRMTPPDSSNPYSMFSPKKSLPSSPLKTSLRMNVHSQKGTSSAKKYALNRTTYGTPFQKSQMPSCISTPNDGSISHGKLRKCGLGRKVTSKTKEVFNSTEDENMSEETVRVEFWYRKKKIGEKKYFGFQTMEVLSKDLAQTLRSEKDTAAYIGMIGLDPIPYNHGIRLTLNDRANTFAALISHRIRDIVIQPILVAAKPSYDKLHLSDFQLLQYLGSGGFSTVYLAKCEVDQRLCALKFIKKESITSAKKAKMLENEKEILFAIDSPDLVDLLYAFETPNYIVFGLEFCSNGNLYTFLHKHKRLSEADARIICHQILNGLEYLHDNSILFRDLKLQNILFNESGKLKITDFGLSKPQISEEDVTYSYCGSPEYMAPEMLAKCGHSYQVDFYALGILLYELIYGVSPFYAPKKEDIFLAIMNSEPRFPKQPQISKEAKELIKGLLLKNPSHRIGSLKGIKQIRNHPWFRVGSPTQSQKLIFNFESMKISSKEVKELKEHFSADIEEENFKKCFFVKSFVNKKLVDDLKNQFIAFPKRKERPEKMVKMNSRFRAQK